LKSKKREATGTNKMEEPKPEIVPRISDTKAKITKR
jgi:hypothetical protein